MRLKVLFTLFSFVSMTLIALSVVQVPSAANSLGSTPELTITTPTPPAKNAKSATGRSANFSDLVFIDTWDGAKIEKTDEEWKKQLTDIEYYVLRQQGTERAFTGELTHNTAKGTYYCAACGLALFKSSAKYDSETGWPSFYQSINKKNVAENVDKSLASEIRTEVHCARCGSHLGHVFDDGPQPTGLRYCMNSVALKFKAGK